MRKRSKELGFLILSIFIVGLQCVSTARASNCDPPPSGIAAWWPGEGNGNDIISGNTATLQSSVSFAPGEVGQAFAMDSFGAYLSVPASASLNVGTNGGLTVEAWINLTNVIGFHPIAEWNNGSGVLGCHMWLGTGPSDVGVLLANIIDTNGIYHGIFSPQNAVAANVFQHVAVTYDQASGVATLYVNGTIVAQSTVGSFVPQTSYDFWMGVRAGDTPGDSTYGSFLGGELDELSIYKRALSSNEVAAIYLAGSAGKCPPPTPPVITSQPTNQTVPSFSSASFTVAATGTPPLDYQWSFDGTNIIGATNATLTLANVQPIQAGNYQVTVSNVGGSTNSAVATLTVLGTFPPQCDPPPSGIAAWWPGDGNGNDIIGGNTATLQSSVSFAPGEVGQAFVMDSFGAYLSVPASASLNVGTNGGLTVEAWINLTNVIGLHPIAEWNNGSGVLGCHMWLGTGPSDVGVLLANIIDTNGIYHGIFSPQNAVAANVFQHVAVTYDQASGVATLYVNGTIVAQSTVGSFVPQTSYDFWMGVRAGDTPGDSTYGSFLGGELDELSIYKRALGSNEIAAIYHAGSAGKCFTPTPPVITTQPSNQTVAVGGTVAFSVAATGTPPLDYQWSFDGTNIIGATNATLTLADVQFNQAGNYQVTVSNAVGSTNSTVATLTPLAPLVITQQPQSEMVPSFSSASFTVAASGPGPLSYQWRKNGTNLVDGGNVSGSATTNLILTSVRLSDAGNYDVLVSNPYATTNSAVAVLTVPETVLSLGSTSAVSGSTIVVPVWMNALGVENAVLASVGYDPTKLALQSVTGTNLTPVYTQTNNGYVGFAVVLNPGATFPAGSNEVADLIFTTLPVTNHATVNLTFGDIPTGRQVVDNNFDSLPAAYLGGTVALSPAEYEADVYPRPNGDSQVNIFDWIEEGRMVAGLDVPTNSDEFARADCAPRNRPNGKLTVADWVQAGRYALGLDPLTPVPPASAHTVAEAKPQGGPISSRMLTVASVSAQRGQTVNVPVLLVCTTNENAVGATIGYNTNLLRFVSATLGASATSGRLNVNTSRLGEVGLALALSPGAAFPPGTNQVAVLQFTTSPSASGTASLALDNTMVQLEVADNTANSLTTAYVNGAIALPDQPALGVKGAGRTLQFSWPLATGTFQVQEANSPTGPWATIMLPLVTNGANVTAACAPTNHQQFFRLEGQ